MITASNVIAYKIYIFKLILKKTLILDNFFFLTFTKQYNLQYYVNYMDVLSQLLLNMKC